MKVKSPLFYSYLVFLVIYAGFTLLPAPKAATLLLYHVSAMSFRIIEVTIVLLMAGIWYAGFYGYSKLQEYAKLIQGNKDGKQIAKLTQGILLLIMWLPVSSVVSAAMNYFAARHTAALAATAIISNYINLLFPLAGFVFIGRGARGLSKIARLRPSYKAVNLVVVLVIYLGLIYYRLVATTFHRDAVYHMSVWLVLTTLVAPYIYMWSIGLRSAYEIYLYSKKVGGIVYRKSWGLLGLGLGWLMVTSIGFQYLTTLSAHLRNLSIYWLVVVVYSLLLVLSLGFVFIAFGTRKLQKIEEV